MSTTDSTGAQTSRVTMADHACALIRRGFRIISVRPYDKLPATSDFENRWTTDEATARDWWSGRDEDNNIGILTGADTFQGGGLIVLDPDVKGADGKSKPGMDSLLDLELTRGLDTNSLTAETPTGGLHLFFKVPPAPAGKTYKRKIGWQPGLDVIAGGMFVVGAGSRREIDGVMKEYRFINDAPIAELPADIAAELLSDEDPPAKPREALPEWANDDSARRSFANHLEGVLANFEPEGSDHDDHEIIARLGSAAGDYGMEPELAAELVLDAGYGGNLDENIRVMRGLFDKRTGEFGCKRVCAEEAFDRVSAEDWAHICKKAQEKEAEKEAEAFAGDNVVSLDEARRAKVKERGGYERFGAIVKKGMSEIPEPLVEDVLDEGALSVWYGASNVGKTFVVLDLADRLAAGEKWAGKRTDASGGEKKALVFYIACEGGRGIIKRLMALAEKRGRGEDHPIAVSRCNFDLFEPSCRRALIRDVRAAERDFDAPCKLIVIDTLARSFGSRDENVQKDMGEYVKHIDTLRAMTGAHVALIHHTGKDESKGARGSSALRAAADTEVRIKKGTIEIAKQRDMEMIAAIPFKLTSIDLGKDGRGARIDSPVVEYGALAGFEPPPEIEAKPPVLEPAGAALTADEVMFDTFDKAAAKRGGTVSASEWLKEIKAHPGQGVRGVPSNAKALWEYYTEALKTGVIVEISAAKGKVGARYGRA